MKGTRITNTHALYITVMCTTTKAAFIDFIQSVTQRGTEVKCLRYETRRTHASRSQLVSKARYIPMQLVVVGTSVIDGEQFPYFLRAKTRVENLGLASAPQCAAS